MIWPVMFAAQSEDRKVTVAAMSPGLCWRPKGTSDFARPSNTSVAFARCAQPEAIVSPKSSLKGDQQA